MFKKVESDLNFQKREKEIIKYWKKNKIFEKSVVINKDKEVYVFYDGPPTANGKPHIGHLLTRVIKDTIPRYQLMKGANVTRKAGWDTHGLPVEIEVEKILGLNGKDQIESYGIDRFNDECRKNVWKYKKMWEDFSSRVAFWVDMDNPYITYDNNYIESVWWSLKKIWEKELLYKGFRIVPYCCRCGTPLSNHEVAQGYKYVRETSLIAKFKLVDDVNTYFLAWTTTPWTLLSNVALCVNPKETYIKVKTEKENYILAKALTNVLNCEFEIVKEFKGYELENIKYEPIFDFEHLKNCFYIVLADYVTLTDGTGIVHIAPAFGDDDHKVGRKYNLPFVQMVNAKGEVLYKTPWGGMFYKNVDKEVIISLKTRNLLFKTLSLEHNYPFCWRCDTPLMYYARDAWYIQMTKVKNELIENNDKINWMPDNIKTGRFGEWLNNLQDWSLSRDRYWGTPLNIWECECGYFHAVGSKEELYQMSLNKLDGVELHRPYIDEVVLVCPKCYKSMKRVKEVIDCWYDSGAMPFAQWHYPFENKEIFDKNFPADFICEAIDQTRGWFYSLLAISTLIFEDTSYKNVIVLGHVVDENGQKMSKSKGNTIDPFEALEEFGADSLRWYFYSNSALYLPNKFIKSSVIESQRKELGTIWNTYAFFVLYANIDKINLLESEVLYDKLNVLDKWILSRLHSLIKLTTINLDNFALYEATAPISKFIDDLSNWYVRNSRNRFWSSVFDNDKISAYNTLYTVLVELSKLLAPFLPFISEQIYTNLVCSINAKACKSVHLCKYPIFNKMYINEELEEKMESAIRVCTLGRNCRSSANIKNRQPISEIYIIGCEFNEYYIDIIKNELNVKNIVFIKDASIYVSYLFKPLLKVVAPKYGKLTPFITKCLLEMDSNKAYNELVNNKCINLSVENIDIILNEDELLVETKQKEGFTSASNGIITIIINTILTDELIEEGIIREIVSKIQATRKEAKFEVIDYIELYFQVSDYLKNIIDKYSDNIKFDTLTSKIDFSLDGYKKEYQVGEESIIIGVKKVIK